MDTLSRDTLFRVALTLSYRDTNSLSCTCRLYYTPFLEDRPWRDKLQLYHGVDEGGKELYKRARLAGSPHVRTIQRQVDIGQIKHRRDVVSLSYEAPYSVFVTITGECWIATCTDSRRLCCQARDAMISVTPVKVVVVVLLDGGFDMYSGYDYYSLSVQYSWKEQIKELTHLLGERLFYLTDSTSLVRAKVCDLSQRRCDIIGENVITYYSSVIQNFFIRDGDPYDYAPIKHLQYSVDVCLVDGLDEICERTGVLYLPHSKILDMVIVGNNMVLLLRNSELCLFISPTQNTSAIDVNVLWMRSSHESTYLVYIKGCW